MAQVQLPLTYPDLVCLDDLDPFANETTSDLQSLFQDVYHVLVQLPGSNPDDITKGVGVQLYLNGTEDQFATLPSTIEAQFQDDERIESCTVTTPRNPDGTFRVCIALGVAGSIIPLEYGWQNGNFTNLTGG